LKPSKKIRVWLASNFMLLRSGLRALLTGRPTLKCIGETGLGGDALELVEKAQPDVLILDVDLHDRRANAVLKRLSSKTPATRIIALSVAGDKRSILRLLRCGVHGYLSHSEATAELVKAIEAVAQGDVFLCPSASVALLNEYRKRARRRAKGGAPAGGLPKCQIVESGE